MRWTEDRVIPAETDQHPGPWVGKQRVYQLEKHKGDDWYMIEELVYDNNGSKISKQHFAWTSGMVGTREFLQMADDEPILIIKNTNRFN